MVKLLHRIQSEFFRSPKFLTRCQFSYSGYKQLHRIRVKFRRIKFLSIQDTNIIQISSDKISEHSGYQNSPPDVIQNVIEYRKMKFWLPPADLGMKGVSRPCPFFVFLWVLALKRIQKFNKKKNQNSSLPKTHRVKTSSILRKNVYNSA
jgi:hypothetical protein